jgi:hypothetical protein
VYVTEYRCSVFECDTVEDIDEGLAMYNEEYNRIFMAFFVEDESIVPDDLRAVASYIRIDNK